MQEVKAYTAGVGRKVHAGAVVASSQVRNGKGVVALCGVYERPGGTWVAKETSAKVDCPECNAKLTAAAGAVKVQKAQAQAAALDTKLWGFDVAAFIENEAKLAVQFEHEFPATFAVSYLGKTKEMGK